MRALGRFETYPDSTFNPSQDMEIPTMKTMTCKQLGGACDKAFSANTFEELAELSKKHGTEMFQQGDADHLKAMNAMRTMMANPGAMGDWFAKKRAEFEALPEA